MKTITPLVLGMVFLTGTPGPGGELAVPEADVWRHPGFAQTRGGLDGRVIRVTTLAGHGPGALREAVEAEGPRVIVFEVGGVIDLDRMPLVITEPHLTIAGQTAPSPGITIIRGSVVIRTHNVVVQHLRVRLGDVQGGGLGGAPDSMGTVGSDVHDVLIDHCSVSWGIDENLSASGPRLDGPEGTSRRITFRNSIIAESLRDSYHPKGKRAMGSLIHDWCRDIALIGNLYAHNYHRNPLFKANTTGVMVNNVIYNAGSEAIHLGRVDHQFRGHPRPSNPRISIVGNTLLYGPDTENGLPLVLARPGGGEVYLRDNAAYDRAGEPAPMTRGDVTILEDKPLWPEALAVLPREEAARWVLGNAGARPNDRDLADRRVVEHVRTGGGRIIDSQEDVGGYPTAQKARHELEVPSTNIGQWLEARSAALINPFVPP